MNKFKVINENGEEIVCDILFTFDSEETKKSYIVYTDNTKDEDGNVQVFASIYDKNEKTPRLQPIETEKEWKIIETILNSMQEQIQNNNVTDTDELIGAVLDDLDNDLLDSELDDFFDLEDDYEIEDDFGIPNPIVQEDLGFIQPIVLKLHIYEKHALNHNPHAPHTKMGEVLIDGTCGTVTLGKSRLCDICIPNSYNLEPVHFMIVIVNGKVMISNLISWSKFFINNQEVKQQDHLNETLHDLNNGDYFTIDHKYKVYVEIVDPSNSRIIDCQLCGKKFIQTLPDIEYCVECRKQLEEEMGIDCNDELIKANLNNYLDPVQEEDLNIKIINIDEQNPKILGKAFKR